ncbi:MAG: helix-turn-helix transcriptional regulator [Solirubrobacteraceae bacterium]
MSVQTSPDGQPAAREIERVLVELLALEREVFELEYMRRADALERTGDAVRVLGELRSTDGILARAAAEFGVASQFDRILISDVTDDGMLPLALWDGIREAGDTIEQLATAPIPLTYPLIEADVVRRRHVATVSAADGRGRALAQLLGAEAYVVAPLTAQGETIGLLHGDAWASGRELDALDAEVMAKFAGGLSGVLERAVLRHTLELHRGELESALQWMSGRLTRLSDARAPEPAQARSEAGQRLVESLTPRELEVLRLMARGQTNREIATALVVREGTVKYHVKNILRKLGATSRADAVARFVRSSWPGVIR